MKLTDLKIAPSIEVLFVIVTPSSTAFSKFTLLILKLSKFKPLKFDEDKLTPLRIVFSKFVFVRFTPVRSNPSKLRFDKLAPVKLTPRRSAPLKLLTNLKSVSLKFALFRFVWEKFVPAMLAPVKLAPERSDNVKLVSSKLVLIKFAPRKSNDFNSLPQLRIYFPDKLALGLKL